MTTNSGNSLSNFLKFFKPKSESENGEKSLRSPSPYLMNSPMMVRRNRTHSVDSAFEESLLEDITFVSELLESESKKNKKASSKVRRKSLSRKHLSVYNNDDVLHNAVMVGNVELTRQILLQDNININAVKSSGWTALHHACRLGNVDLIRLLLDHGANLSLLTTEGYSPLRIANLHGNFDAASYLIHDRGIGSEEIRDGFQEKKPYALLVTLKSNTKHAKITKTKSVD